MKHWRTIIITLLGLLVLAACSGAAEVELVTEVVNEETAVEVVEFVAELDPNRDYSQNDLSLVAASDKPQFLNSYADW